MIRLEHLGKTYPGSELPVVEDATLDVLEGEIVIFVGPSGCGKTTTMRMINRLIEPTRGRIELDGEDVTRVDGKQLRRRIGYVIQQVGLFPHLKVGANVGMTPNLLGWDKRRTSARIDEMLELVGLDPAVYRNRYPRELSGGQQQRVGVARALAADPPVMLMDEPFGAVDPITRERLQNEFLRLQSELHKTIVFVTHDIDEAIKMGDRIAVLGDRFRVEQYDTPDRILAEPGNDFVASFVGAGSSLKRLTLHRVSDLDLAEAPTARVGTPRGELRARLGAGEDWLLLLDDAGRPASWLEARELAGDDGSPTETPVLALGPDASLRDAMDAMLRAANQRAVVVDSSGRYQGLVRLEAVIARIGATEGDQNSYALGGYAVENVVQRAREAEEARDATQRRAEEAGEGRP
jgi:osmoprotectant transport system ATP-binding protein